MAQGQRCRNRSLKLPQYIGLVAGRLPLVGGYARRLFGTLELDTASLGNWTAPLTTEQAVAEVFAEG